MLLLLFALLLKCSSLFTATAQQENITEWQTLVHEPGYCALYGICGHRADNDVLSCPINTRARPLSKAAYTKLQGVCPQLTASSGGADGRYCCTEEQIDVMRRSFLIPSVFIASCPACDHNFKHFLCMLTCSPNQAVFTNVTEVQLAHDNNFTAAKEVSYYVAPPYGSAVYNSCKDVMYSAGNQKAMFYLGGGATGYQEWFDYVGLVKDKRTPPIGSPYQLNFPSVEDMPAVMHAMHDMVPTCWDAAYKCGCGDCPDAPTCAPPPPPPRPPPYGCVALALPPHGPSCVDLGLLLAFVGMVVATLYAIAYAVQHPEDDMDALLDASLQQALLAADGGGNRVSGGVNRASGLTLTPTFVDPLIDDPEIEPEEGDVAAVQAAKYVRVERRMRRFFARLGRWCAGHAELTLVACASLLVLCMLGLLHLHIETEPQRLWVGPQSQAAKDKRAYEAAFGPFYRIEQLILSTTPAHTSSSSSSAAAAGGVYGVDGGRYLQAPTPSGLPPIVTDENIRLLFAMQALVDDVRGVMPDGEEEGGKENGGEERQGEMKEVGLQDVCFKPFGDACATQSILQYWHMDPHAYETRASHTPEYCFTHTTECRSAFQAPIDPALVLGGFPRDVVERRNYSADATAFVITYPVDNSIPNRKAALAWEAAFLKLAKGRLSDMAAAANLSLSYSAERSVQDELSRESGTDIITVIASYIAMLLYITIAMARFPPNMRPLGVTVHTRGMLGLVGMVIVIGAVGGALGLLGWMGLSGTLIIMEVIPFLVLAVGVDNMFILSHALHRQDRRTSMPQRLGCALAEVGPSVTLAAACEVLAFGLGGLTGMPAIRNFSLCAAAAVALDYVLQVTAFVALLALDQSRLESLRCDLLPCIQLPTNVVMAPPPPASTPGTPMGGGVPSGSLTLGGAEGRGFVRSGSSGYMGGGGVGSSPGIAIMSSPYQGPLPIGSSSAPRIATTTSSAGVGSGGLPTGPLGTTSNPPSYGPLNPLRASVSSSSLVGLTGGPVGSYRQQQGLVRVSSSQGSLAALGTTPTSTTNPRPPPPVAQIHAPTVDNTPAPTRTLLHTKSTSSSSFKLTNTPGVTTTSVTAGGAGLTAGGGGNVPPAAAAASGVSPWLLATGVSAVLQAPEYEPDGIGVEPMLQWYMEHVHLPLLLRRRISRVCVVFFFGVLFLGALGALPHVERGLEQSIALPRDSYLQSYYADINILLRVGPPVMFVVEDMVVAGNASHVNRVCSISGCDDDSMLNQITTAARQPALSYLATPAASWLDDYLVWISPQIPECCRQWPNATHCPTGDGQPCVDDPSACASCDTCFLSGVSGGGVSGGGVSGGVSGGGVSGGVSGGGGTFSGFRVSDGVGHGVGHIDIHGGEYPGSQHNGGQHNGGQHNGGSQHNGGQHNNGNLQSNWKQEGRVLEHGRPSLQQIQQTLPWFLESAPGMHCAKGGRGAYDTALQQTEEGGRGVGLDEGVVRASAFRANNVPLAAQQDFIKALEAARSLASQLSHHLGLHVYPFSVFHVFFEQYLTIVEDSLSLLTWALAAVMLVCCVLTETVWGACMILVVICMVLVDMVGVMWLWGIQLNAVSLVNLVMSTGIAVEFCAHILRAFLVASGTRQQRAEAALRGMGASVMCGITLTKFIGVLVLAFAHTAIFEVYYFRMYFALVLLGAGHGLVLLPVLLCMVGPPSLVRRSAER